MKIGSVTNNMPLSTPNIKHVSTDNMGENVQELEDGSQNVQQITTNKDVVGEDERDSVEPEILAKSVEQANKTLKLYDRTLELSVHEVTHTIMYKLKDTRTNEVIMEFPPKKIQDMIAKMWELAGLFVDEKA
jgi:flagellar protein FlaG